MKILIIGGTGHIGSNLTGLLRAQGHEVTPAAPSTGVDTITGQGVAEAVAGQDVVVDVSNAPAWDDQAVLHFFTTSTSNLLAAERAAGVQLHVALTIVGAERAPDSGYLRAKVAQEKLIKESGQPYTIVRSTQFFEFLRPTADAATEGTVVRVPNANLQPIAAVDVAAAVTDVAVSDPLNGIMEIAGPEKIKFAKLVGDVLAADKDLRTVVAEDHARYFGTELDDGSITAGPDARLGAVTFAQWLAANH